MERYDGLPTQRGRSTTAWPPAVERSVRALFPQDAQRRAHVERWLEAHLARWALQPALAGRWLAVADPHLRAPGELVVLAAHDAAADTVSLELWRDDRRVYGMADWVG